MAGLHAVFTDPCATREQLMQREINRLEALVLAEHNRGNEYLSMLHETQSTVMDLMALLHPKARAPLEITRQEPIGGFESPTAKAARLSRESFEKAQKAKSQVTA
jgi:Mg2+ and Co2+ transporter CorA